MRNRANPSEELSKVDELIKTTLEVIPEMKNQELNDEIKFDQNSFKSSSQKLTKLDSMLKGIRSSFLKFTKQATLCEQTMNSKVALIAQEMNRILSEALPIYDSRNNYDTHSSVPNSTEVIGREISLQNHIDNKQLSKENK